MTVNLQINFLAPANGDALTAKARAVQAGGSIGVAQVEITTLRDGAEQLCAIATVTLRAIDMPKPA